MTPTLSIIIPCYNHGKYIRETLQSVKDCGETLYPYEIIIVNDGSTDEYTLRVLTEISNDGYRVVHQKNAGLGAARNNAISLAKGKYILPLDSDNKVCPPYLTEAIDILEKNNDITIVYSDAAYFGDKKGIWTVGPYNLQKLMWINCIDACTVYRKEMWERMNGYSTDLPFMGYEDYDLWLRASFAGYKFYYLQKIGFEYRVLGSSMIHTLKWEEKQQVYAYLNNKYPAYLNRPYVEEMLMNRLRSSKKQFIRLFFLTFFPSLMNWIWRLKKKNHTEIL
jgi:glycosyltransferase involved in cell wall biosynthesis